MRDDAPLRGTPWSLFFWFFLKEERGGGEGRGDYDDYVYMEIWKYISRGRMMGEEK